VCEKCSSLIACNIHLCPTAALQTSTSPQRTSPTLRLPTDAPTRTGRTTPRIPSTFTLLDAAAKQ
jgi:hypothetical protein